MSNSIFSPRVSLRSLQFNTKHPYLSSRIDGMIDIIDRITTAQSPISSSIVVEEYQKPKISKRVLPELSYSQVKLFAVASLKN